MDVGKFMQYFAMAAASAAIAFICRLAFFGTGNQNYILAATVFGAISTLFCIPIFIMVKNMGLLYRFKSIIPCLIWYVLVKIYVYTVYGSIFFEYPTHVHIIEYVGTLVVFFIAKDYYDKK